MYYATTQDPYGIDKQTDEVGCLVARNRGWFDAQCQGYPNDYCKHIIDYHSKDVHLSCAMSSYWECSTHIERNCKSQHSDEGTFFEEELVDYKINCKDDDHISHGWSGLTDSRNLCLKVLNYNQTDLVTCSLASDFGQWFRAINQNTYESGLYPGYCVYRHDSQYLIKLCKSLGDDTQDLNVKTYDVKTTNWIDDAKILLDIFKGITEGLEKVSGGVAGAPTLSSYFFWEPSALQSKLLSQQQATNNHTEYVDLLLEDPPWRYWRDIWPNQHGRVVHLRITLWGRNIIRGTLSSDIFKLERMRAYNTRLTEVTGPLPSTAGIPLTGALRSIDLGQSAFTGSLPSEWPEDLVNVQVVKLDDNKLAGPVPESWMRLTAFQKRTSAAEMHPLYINITGTQLCWQPEQPGWSYSQFVMKDETPLCSKVGQDQKPTTTTTTYPQSITGGGDDQNIVYIVPLIIVCVLILVCLAVLGVLMWKLRRSREQLWQTASKTAQPSEGSGNLLITVEYGKEALQQTSSWCQQEIPNESSILSIVDQEEQSGDSGMQLPDKILVQQQKGVNSNRTIMGRGSVDINVDINRDLVLLSQLGCGGFGVVYKAQWNTRQGIQKTVAVKMLNSTNFSDVVSQDERQKVFNAFYEEINTMLRLRHPGIVEFYGACLKPPVLAVLMEYMDGGSLDHYLHQGQKQIAYDEILSVIHAIVQVLCYLHPHILHRDIKPSNILLNRQGNIKLADFGLSKIKSVDKGLTFSNAIGTPAYLAPEVWRDQKCTTKSDIYQLGLVAWEMVSGERPWGDCINVGQIMHNVLNLQERPKIPLHCPMFLENLIQDCWAQDPQLRPTAEQIRRLVEVELGKSTHQTV